MSPEIPRQRQLDPASFLRLSVSPVEKNSDQRRLVLSLHTPTSDSVVAYSENAPMDGSLPRKPESEPHSWTLFYWMSCSSARYHLLTMYDFYNNEVLTPEGYTRTMTAGERGRRS